jgi:hypothetical protein
MAAKIRGASSWVWAKVKSLVHYTDEERDTLNGW